MLRLLPQLLQPEFWREAETSGPLIWDSKISQLARESCTPFSVCQPILNFFTDAISIKIILIYIALLFFWWITKTLAIKKKIIFIALCALAIGVGDFLSNQLKYALSRLRPHHNLDDLQKSVKISFSLPSNHAFNTALIVGIFYILYKAGYKKAKIPLLFFGTICLGISLARVFQGQHYPIDVLTSWILAALYSSLLCRLVMQRSQLLK